MSLPLSAFYFIYLGLVGVFLLFSFFNLYHLLRFGSPLAVTLTMSALYLLGVFVLLGTSWMYLRGMDWTVQIQLLPTDTGMMGGFR